MSGVQAHPITWTGAGIAIVTIAAAVVSGVLIHNQHASAQEGDAVDVALSEFRATPPSRRLAALLSERGLVHQRTSPRSDAGRSRAPPCDMARHGSRVDTRIPDGSLALPPGSPLANGDSAFYERGLPGRPRLGPRRQSSSRSRR